MSRKILAITGTGHIASRVVERAPRSMAIADAKGNTLIDVSTGDLLCSAAKADVKHHGALSVLGTDGIQATSNIRVKLDREDLDPCSADRLAERTRIAQELHDTLLQGLFGVSLQLRAAVDSLSADGAAKFVRPLQAMDRVLEEGRRAVQGLRSSCAHYPSLGHAFAGVPGDLGLASAEGFRVVIEGRLRELRPVLCDEVYRIGREAIVNAHRHAHANHIEAVIQYRSTGLRIVVRDNGCGIDPGMLRRNGHWGVQGMRERAEGIGATLNILTKVALGTEVQLCVPGRVAFAHSEVRAAC